MSPLPHRSHRVPGRSDLKRIATLSLALALLVAGQSVASPQAPEPEPPPELGEEETFLAPFVNASFLIAVKSILDEIQLFKELTTGVYLDKRTNLLWTSRDNGRDIDWRRAAEYCSQLELAGFTDWRLPTLAELEDFMDPMSQSAYSLPKQVSLSSCCVWSSTSKDEVAAWNFNYRYSKKFTGSKTHTYDLRALCVRQWSEKEGWLPDRSDPAAIE